MESLFFDALNTIKNIPYLRKHVDPVGLKQAEQILNQIDDFLREDLFVNLNIYPDDYFKDDIHEIYKKLLNYCHKTNDLFLGYYTTLVTKGNEFDIQLTSLKIIIKCLINSILSSQYISISKDLYHNYVIDIQIADYEDILELKFSEIPPFRYLDKTKNELIYVDKKDINAEISGLKQCYRTIQKTENINSKQYDYLMQHANDWWNKYREYIDASYYEVRHLFEFYKGAKVEFIISKSRAELDNIDTESGLVLCEVKSSNENGLVVDIDKNIHEVLFYDFPRPSFVMTHFGYDAENDMGWFSDGSIQSEINDELFNIISTNEDNKYFDLFVDLVLSLYGYTKYKFDTCYLKRDLFSENIEQIELIRINKTHVIAANEMKRQADKSKWKKVIFAYEEIFLSDIRKQLRYSSNIVLLDSKNLMSKLRYMLNESLLSQAMLNEFIKPQINLLTADKDKLELHKYATVIENDLRNCPVGKAGWKEYESICYKAIRYLFEDGFNPFIAEYQLANDIKTDIRDLIVLNTGLHNFWQDMKMLYNCNNIVMEFKNYNDSIGNDGFRQISDYLEKDVYGQFGIIFARKDLDKSSKRKQIDYLRNRNKKLILVIDDDKLIDMIRLKAKGSSPESVLVSLKFLIETSV